MRYSGWQAEPGMHRFFPDRVARRREGIHREGIHREGADRDAVDGRVAIALPVQVAAARRAEMKADLVAAVGAAREDFAFALEPHALLQIGRAEMKGGAGTPPAGLAMAEIDARGLACGDDLEPAAMALRLPFHVPSSLRRFRSLLPIAADTVECGLAACLRSAAFLGSEIEIDRVFLKHPSLKIAMHDEMIARRCQRACVDRLFHIGIEPQIELFVEPHQWEKPPQGFLEIGFVDVVLSGEP